MMRIDQNGNPDICRSVGEVLSAEQIASMNAYKLTLNTLIDDLTAESVPTEGKRYIALARTSLEEACMWITKAICTPRNE